MGVLWIFETVGWFCSGLVTIPFRLWGVAPWTLRATCLDGPGNVMWKVAGPRSVELMQEVAEAIEEGRDPSSIQITYQVGV